MSLWELEELIERAAREDWDELDLTGQGIKALPVAIGKCKCSTLCAFIDNLSLRCEVRAKHSQAKII